MLMCTNINVAYQVYVRTPFRKKTMNLVLLYNHKKRNERVCYHLCKVCKPSKTYVVHYMDCKRYVINVVRNAYTLTRAFIYLWVCIICMQLY